MVDYPEARSKLLHMGNFDNVREQNRVQNLRRKSQAKNQFFRKMFLSQSFRIHLSRFSVSLSPNIQL